MPSLKLSGTNSAGIGKIQLCGERTVIVKLQSVASNISGNTDSACPPPTISDNEKLYIE